MKIQQFDQIIYMDDQYQIIGKQVLQKLIEITGNHTESRQVIKQDAKQIEKADPKKSLLMPQITNDDQSTSGTGFGKKSQGGKLLIPRCDDNKRQEDFNNVFHVEDQIINHKKKIIYYVRQLLGNGTFGQVILCQSSQGPTMAMKVIKKQPAYINQGLLQVKLLRQISKIEKATSGSKENYLNLYDAFMWQGYLCIAMEVMDGSMLNILQSTKFSGLQIAWIQKWAKQILLSLAKIHKMGIFHSDIKPENIMFRAEKTDKPILIDFSSACTPNLQPFTYIQSRFYRSPEVLLGLKPYNQKIDMWSLGCSLVQLYLGFPLFPGACSYDQMEKICTVVPYSDFNVCKLQKSQFGFKYFKESANNNQTIQLMERQQYQKKNNTQIKTNEEYYNFKNLDDILKIRNFSKKNIQTHELFLDLIKKMIHFDSQSRISAQEAFLHPFIGGTFQQLEQVRLIQDLQTINKE